MATVQKSPNGTDPRAAAIASEQAIADEAAEIRGDTTELTAELYLKLLPLLRRPIPEGFIESIPAVKGKPYESTGIKSVQVQFDRMDNVLTPLWWDEEVAYEKDGALCHVTVYVRQGKDGRVLSQRSSMGGVNQASTVGNLYKGSYTNAAKVAFARTGPGHEVYVGVTDLDPDVHEPSANAQGAEQKVTNVDQQLKPESVQKVKAAFLEAGVKEKDWPMYLTRVGLDDEAKMTAANAIQLREILDAWGKKVTS